LVAALPSRSLLRQKHSRDYLVWLQPHPLVADVGVEVLYGHAPHSNRPNDFQLRSQAKQRRRRIAGECRPAACPTRRNMAKVAILLNAEPARPPPLQRLVVPDAACVQAYIAAQRTHV